MADAWSPASVAPRFGPGLALLGVVGLTEPWHGEIDPAGLLSADSVPSAGARSSC